MRFKILEDWAEVKTLTIFRFSRISGEMASFEHNCKNSFKPCDQRNEVTGSNDCFSAANASMTFCKQGAERDTGQQTALAVTGVCTRRHSISNAEIPLV